MFYHISSKKYDCLKTLEKQGKPSEKPHFQNYDKHISLFFEPPPYDILGSIFEKDHKTWHDGNFVFEHGVEIKNFGDFAFEVVEFPENTELYYDDNVTTEEYLKRKEKLSEYYSGNTTKKLLDIQEKMKGLTRLYYTRLKQRNNFEKVKNYYAATVPHVLLYPTTGQIKVSEVKRKVIESEKVILKDNSNSFYKWVKT